jgi:hypothetical protein
LEEKEKAKMYYFIKKIGIIMLFIAVILLVNYSNHLILSGYRLTISAATQYGINNMYNTYDAEIKILYKINNDTYINLLANDNNIGIVSVKKKLIGYKFNSCSFGGNKYIEVDNANKLIINKAENKYITGKHINKIIVNYHGYGEIKTGFYAMAFKYNNYDIDKISLETYKPSLLIINDPYALMIWNNGNVPPKFFIKDHR